VTKLVIFGLISLRILPILLIGAPSYAHAGILSMVSSLFITPSTGTEETLTTNSQKMPLLEAPINSDVRAGTAPIVATVGQALIPESASAKASNATPNYNTHNDHGTITTYVVKTGDTVSDIAEQFNISVNTIIWANDLKREDMVKVGQKLVILPISGVQHKVVAGDNLSSIALKYKGNVDEIMSFNGLEKATALKVGDIVVIPDGEMTRSQVAATPKVSTVASKVATAALGVRVASASGYYTRPIAAGIRTQGIHGYNGVDLADSCGTPIYASAAGEVVVSKSNSGYNGGYGNYVVINHDNGSQTLYSHMQAVSVAVGQQVNKGEQIGTIGATGKVDGPTGCHVHFEIRNGASNPF